MFCTHPGRHCLVGARRRVTVQMYFVVESVATKQTTRGEAKARRAVTCFIPRLHSTRTTHAGVAVVTACRKCDPIEPTTHVALDIRQCPIPIGASRHPDANSTDARWPKSCLRGRVCSAASPGSSWDTLSAPSAILSAIIAHVSMKVNPSRVCTTAHSLHVSRTFVVGACPARHVYLLPVAAISLL